MASSVHQFFMSQALHLKEGRIEEVARGYSVPLIVALPDVEPGFVILSSRREIEHFFRLKHDGLKDAGVPYLRVQVTETQETAQDRYVAQVEWYYMTPDGERAGRTTARYFLEQPETSLSVQMIEFERIAMPAIVAWFLEAGQPAQKPSGIMLH